MGRFLKWYSEYYNVPMPAASYSYGNGSSKRGLFKRHSRQQRRMTRQRH